MTDIAANIQTILATLPQGVRMLAVSKFRPVEELEAAYASGQRLFAESRPVEFAGKVQALPEDIEWHFIGHLQTNKLKYVLPHASLIHSVDSPHLFEAISKYAGEHGLKARVLLEVHIAREEAKHGFMPEEVEDFIKNAMEDSNVEICGLMGMASNTDDPARIEKDFETIEKLYESVKEKFPSLRSFTELSIGMSEDYPIALKHGATIVRIGSAIFLG